MYSSVTDLLIGTAGLGRSSAFVSDGVAKFDTVECTDLMTSGKLSVGTGLLDTNEDTIVDVIRMISFWERTLFSILSVMYSTSMRAFISFLKSNCQMC